MNELTINLKDNHEKSLYEQIYVYIKGEIMEGRISFGERLPSTRALSKHLQVSRSTVSLAYEQLLSEGYIEAVPYKGYYVAPIEGLYRFVETAPKGISRQNSKEQDEEIYEFDFSPAGIDLDSFPYNTWRKISKEILYDDKVELFQLGDSKGELSLRETISKYLYQARGVNCEPEQIIVGAGNDYLLMLLSGLIGNNHVVAMENPTYKHAYDIFKSLEYNIVTIDMDKHGIKVKELSLTDGDIAYVMPSHQYPLGIVMPIKRRLELLNWASEKKGRFIIEDDYDSEFRYKGKPIPSLQGYDVNDTVIYIGTFSKSIAPAIRVSYMVLPKQLLNIYDRMGSVYTSTVSRIDQEIITKFFEEGYYERHLNKMRGIYKSKHDLLINELKSVKGNWSISGENAGVHILMKFHNGMDEEELICLAKEEKVKVYGLSQYCIPPSKTAEDPTIILGYGTLLEKDIKEAVKRLSRAWIQKKK